MLRRRTAEACCRGSRRGLECALGAPRFQFTWLTQPCERVAPRVGQGDQTAFDQLVPIVHAELRRLARRHMAKERSGHTLQPTALVNEVYLRLVDLRRMQWKNRAQFFAICATLMRRVLVDIARARQYQKRGGGAVMVTFDANALPAVQSELDIVALDDALSALGEMDPRKARVVDLRFFGGLSVDETAEILGMSADTPCLATGKWRKSGYWRKSSAVEICLRTALNLVPRWPVLRQRWRR